MRGLLLWLCVALSPSSALAIADSTWYLGQWEMESDEDKSAPYDLFEFRADGTWVDYGPACKEFAATFHVHDGNLYVTSAVPDKGPIVMVFRPSKDHKTLTYTSPRTRNNATFRRATRAPCPLGGTGNR